MVGVFWNKCWWILFFWLLFRIVGRKIKNELFVLVFLLLLLLFLFFYLLMWCWDVLRNMVFNVVCLLWMVVVVVDYFVSYWGVRYWEGLSKYVMEIWFMRSLKKIWFGIYDMVEEVVCVFDIGNLCCKKNLLFNFVDLLCLLKRILFKLFEEECWSVIVKFVKEVVWVVVMKLVLEGEMIN